MKIFLLQALNSLGIRKAGGPPNINASNPNVCLLLTLTIYSFQINTCLNVLAINLAYDYQESDMNFSYPACKNGWQTVDNYLWFRKGPLSLLDFWLIVKSLAHNQDIHFRGSLEP